MQTLEGMVLSSPLSVNAIINDTIIDDYNQYIETHTPNEELLHAMQQTYFSISLASYSISHR